MRRNAILATLALVVTVGTTVVMTDDDFGRRIREVLTGHEELPLVLTNGRGFFTARINEDGTEISYKLRYSGLESNATQAHIHIGQPGINGGVSVYLCLNPNPPSLNPPAAPADLPPTCPLREGEVEGVLAANDVVGPANQGVLAGDFGRLLYAIRTGNTYVNVHTVNSPGGEIRHQIDHNRRDDDHDHD